MAEDHPDDRPLTPAERNAYETDLISFCDRELDRLGDIQGLDVLYAGGAALLWIEGLSQRIGALGSLTALEIAEERIKETKLALSEADLRAPVRIFAGDIFDPPFKLNSFELAYSAGLFHELDVREKPAERAMRELVRIVRPGGRISTSDFVDTTPAVQIEEERLIADLSREVSGKKLYGINLPDRLVALHERFLSDVRWYVSAPHPVRYLDRLALDEEEPSALQFLPTETTRTFRVRRENLRRRIDGEGYTRPATLYVEGIVVA